MDGGMDCVDCERMKDRLLEANLKYINADTEMQKFSRRSIVTEHDGHTYRLLIERLHEARVAYESVHRQMVTHQLTHKADVTTAAM
jgi:hypothetical protein